MGEKIEWKKAIFEKIIIGNFTTNMEGYLSADSGEPSEFRAE